MNVSLVPGDLLQAMPGRVHGGQPRGEIAGESVNWPCSPAPFPLHWIAPGSSNCNMALKPTIYKAQVELADSDRNCFESLSLTLAKHPSETLERMAVRLLAYCLNCTRGLEFTRGLSTADEPDVWVHSDSGELQHWIEVGQPEPARLRKACGRARQVTVYAFANSTPTWWNLNSEAIDGLPHLRVWQFTWGEVQAATHLIGRTVQLNVSIVGGTLYLDNGSASVSLTPTLLCQND